MLSWNISELKRKYSFLGPHSHYDGQDADWLILRSDLQNLVFTQHPTDIFPIHHPVQHLTLDTVAGVLSCCFYFLASRETWLVTIDTALSFAFDWQLLVTTFLFWQKPKLVTDCLKAPSSRIVYLLPTPTPAPEFTPWVSWCLPGTSSCEQCNFIERFFSLSKTYFSTLQIQCQIKMFISGTNWAPFLKSASKMHSGIPVQDLPSSHSPNLLTTQTSQPSCIQVGKVLSFNKARGKRNFLVFSTWDPLGMVFR